MTEHFFPQKFAERRSWALNYHDEIPVQGLIIGLLPGDITARQARCQNMINAIDAQVAAENAKKTATTNRNLVIKNEYAELAKNIAADKTLNTYTNPVSQALRTVGSDGHFDPLTYVTELSIAGTPEGPRIAFKKLGAEGVRIYSRLLNAPAWQFLALDLHSPYVDTRPTPVGFTETREYMAMGWWDDHEIGMQSNIVSITVGV